MAPGACSPRIHHTAVLSITATTTPLTHPALTHRLIAPSRAALAWRPTRRGHGRCPPTWCRSSPCGMRRRRAFPSRSATATLLTSHESRVSERARAHHHRHRHRHRLSLSLDLECVCVGWLLLSLSL
ncbi:hypothetical protein M758_8G182300 [Ceratodon purpureus]|nr:hypothetical protein M758_8G182300 [Ceratodon purpureus]